VTDQIGADQTRLVVGLRVTDERLERRLKAMLVEEATVTLGDADDADIVVTDTLHVTDDHPALLVVPGGQVTGFIRGERLLVCQTPFPEKTSFPP
jgi:hypothetical protein